MIIVSQNKKRIINFDTIQEIEINGPGTWGQSFYSVDTYPLGEGDHNHIRLGKYETEERAKEVLQEIIKEYKKVEINIGNELGVKAMDFPKVYEMPEE